MIPPEKIKVFLIVIFVLVVIAAIFVFFFGNRLLNQAELFLKPKSTINKTAVILGRSLKEQTEHLYGKVISQSGASFTVRKIERYQGANHGEELFLISVSPATKFNYNKRVVNQWNVQVFESQNGTPKDIQKDWYVKVEYDPEKAETTTSKDGTTITTNPALKIDYSRPEYPPFLQ